VSTATVDESRSESTIAQPSSVSPEKQDEGAKPPSKPASPISNFRWLVDSWAANSIAAEAGGGKKKAATLRLAKELRAFAAEIAGPHPTAIERTLSETAALAWLAARFLEVGDFTAEERSISQALCAMRRVDAAHRRYLTALRTLATVRKLAVPALVQVNVGKQVNAIAAKSVEGTSAKSS
jgi:hypothetical protein